MEQRDILALKAWFKSHRRPLPWRGKVTPYAVWVSEVMLQQTQVAVVIPYFNRWMSRFPTLLHLAHASEADVLKYWEGLGYYSRVRRLHTGAQLVAQRFNGELPKDETLLATIPGLGPYTIGAIRSFAFHERSVALDGNVKRVLARYYAFEGEIESAATTAALKNKAEELLPPAEDEPWLVMEALIELGALVCQRRPHCASCPLQGGCSAYRLNIAEKLPRRRLPPLRTTLHRAVAIITLDSAGEIHYLIKCVPKGKIMAGLAEFPYLELSQPLGFSSQLLHWVHELTQAADVTAFEPMTSVRHSFTRYNAILYPQRFYLKSADVPAAPPGYQWVSSTAIRALTFPSGHRSLAKVLD